MVRRMAESGACGSDHSLAGLRVLVTRARHQSAGLVTLIEQHGGTAIRFPVIEILPARDPRAARAAMAKLDDFALVIFVSPNAVEHGLAMLDTARVPQTRAAFAAVGESTAAALAQAGMSIVARTLARLASRSVIAWMTGPPSLLLKRMMPTLTPLIDFNTALTTATTISIREIFALTGELLQLR